jgi:hypothetical protein
LNKKWFPIVLIVVLGVTLLVIKQFKNKNEPAPKPKVTNNNKKDPAGSVDRDRGFDRRTSYLEYSKHAGCRMQCRQKWKTSCGMEISITIKAICKIQDVPVMQ